MNILGIDTSSKTLAFMVGTDGELCAFHNYSRQMRHAKHMVRCLDTVLHKAEMSLADIECIACGVGPGSYTGLRIGHSFVKGLAVGRHIPVYPFLSMDVIAYNIQKCHDCIAVVLDARQDKVYFALYERKNNELHRCVDVCVCTLDEMRAHLKEAKNVAVTGDALKRYREYFATIVADESLLYDEKRWYVRAQHMVRVIGKIKKKNMIDPVQLVPCYLRESEAEEKRRQAQ